ncbi:hypothetical protein CCACVL1_01794, partial [Corchorus capsularis]
MVTDGITHLGFGEFQEKKACDFQKLIFTIPIKSE